MRAGLAAAAALGVLLAGDLRKSAFAVQSQSEAPAVEVGAKAAFYDPFERRELRPRETGATGLRPVTVIRPFPPFGAVGIHYWLQDDTGRATTESRLVDAQVATARLHLRSNTGGFRTLRDQAGAPVLATETDHATAGEIGTYVVNQRGGPVAAEILLGRP